MNATQPCHVHGTLFVYRKRAWEDEFAGAFSFTTNSGYHTTGAIEHPYFVIERVEYVHTIVTVNSDVFAVKLSLDEALINAIRHGNQYDRSKNITVGYRVDDEQVIITVADQGEGFDPNELPNPTTETNRWKQGGRGIFLIRAYMDEVAFNERGNQIWLIKKMSSDKRLSG